MDRLGRAALLFGAAFVVLLGTHFALLALPFYWDELGQFVPAALDIYHRLAWVPFTTVPNVHPPGLMAYLALTWYWFGFSVEHTRVAMLVVSAAVLCAAWLLAFELTGKRATAFLATLFLFACPLFFAQAALAQLDLPATLFTTLAMILFLRERYGWCLLICCAGVMVKETAIVAPALFGFLLLQRRRISTALWFTVPLVPLILWLLTLKSATGHLFGSPEFTDYNLFYPLNPVRLGLALLRRGYYLLAGSGHILGTLALIWWWRRNRDEPLSAGWRLALAFVALHVILISVLGGAVLERYLLPALPVLYAAFAMGLSALPAKVSRLASFALAGCLAVACFVNPPYPFPMENNLAWTTFVAVNRDAAQYAEAMLGDVTIATSFPLAGALRRPELGYVGKPLHVLEINDFRAGNLTGPVQRAGALIQYSVMWDPLGTLENRWWVKLLTRYYGYVPQATPEQVPGLTGMRKTFRTCSGGQCITVFERPRVIPPAPATGPARTRASAA